MAKGMRMPSNRRWIEMLPALRTSALNPDILRDCLSASGLREGEVDDGAFSRSHRLRHKLRFVFWTSLHRFYEDDATGLRSDPVEGRVTFPFFRFCRYISFLPTLLSD